MSTSSEEYLSSLRELTFNSRPQINMLTMLAEDYYADAADIAFTIESYLSRFAGDKLPILYLIDSIVKNVRKDYVELFSRNLPTLFAKVFEEANFKVRSSLFKLRTTWDGVFPKEKLAQLDALVNQMDSEWPVVVRPSNIHVNPNFIKGGSDRCTAVKGDIMREKLLKEKKVLLELKKKKVELELLQTKEVLEKEQKKLESFTTFKGETKPLPPDYSLAYLEKIHQPVEVAQPTSSVKSIESENSKKLLEVSIRDPRRKTRQKDPPVDSPLSGGTDSPVTTDLESMGSPYNSEDSRDRPPRKKYKSKDKKRPKERDKESSKEQNKPYKPKLEEASVRKRDNGHSYKPASDVCYDYGDMDLDSPQDNRLVDELLSLQPANYSEAPVSTNNASKPLDVVHSSDELIKDSTDVPPSITVDNLTAVKQQKVQPSENDSSSRSRDPRLAADSKSLSNELLLLGILTKPTVDTFPDKDHVPSACDSPSDNPSASHKPPAFTVLDVPSSFGNVQTTKESQGVETCQTSSIDTPVLEEVKIKSPESLSLEEIMNVEEDSDPSTKVTSKRKLDQEEDNEKHKKRLISELTESETEPYCPVGSSGHLTLTSPPSPEAPPPPSIPPLVDKHAAKEDLEIELSKSGKVDPITPLSPSLVNSEEMGKDIDLRLLLPRPVDRVKEEVKVDNTELDPMALFGGEDVDYRQKPPQTEFSMPSPPPPPVISNLHEGGVKKSWAQIKDRKSEERSPKVRPDRSKRSSISQTRMNSSQKELSRQDSEAHYNLLIKDAEDQLRNGNITFVEYHKMLQEVVTINEERILKEAKARYSNPPTDNLEDSRTDSPVDDVESCFESDRNVKTRDSDNSREIGRVLEHPRITGRMMEPPQLDPRGITPRQTLLPEEPFKRDRPDRDRFNFPERRDMQPPPPNIIENFARTRPQMQPCPPFPGPNIPFQMNFRPRMPQNMVSTLLPHAGVELLMEADRERLDSILIGGQMRQVRFYGSTAVVLQSWDDPREVRFPVEQRSLFVDTRHEFILGFGDPPIEIIIDGMSSLVQLGAPTRELYIDNKFFSIHFGGRPIEVLMCGRVRSICLAGPPPIVRFGPVKRTDLVAGSVSLYVNAKTHFQFHLDAKPQKFHIEGEPCVLQFADSLQTVLINGVPVPLEFGSSPHPVMFKGVTHFLRLTCLPYGIVPGQISIMNMESFAHPPTPMMPPPMMPPPPMVEPAPPQVFLPLPIPPSVQQQPVDLLASMMNPPPALPVAPSDKSYSVEPPAPVTLAPEEPSTESSTQEATNFNINDLFQKLIQTGILHSGSSATPTPDPPEVKVAAPPEIEADFSRPESLKAARPALVTKLYSGIQCSSCGIRFPPEGTKMYSRHLDWHFRQNRREKHSTKRPQCRGWYYDFSNWMQYQELEDPEEEDPEHRDEGEEEDTEEDIPSVAVGHRKDVACRVCGEKFEEFFDHETEEWHARNALLVEESFYHPLCYEEFKNKKEAEGTEPLPVEVEDEDEGPPLEDPSIEFIDLDDTEVPSPVPSPESESLPLLGVDKQDSPEIIAIDDTDCEVKEEEEPCSQEVTKVEEPIESDDDILDIIPIERKIESVELLDDDEEEKCTADNSETRMEEEDFDFSKVTVKQEKDRVALDNVDSSQPTYTTTIDGNIVHDTAAPLVLPNRIKININRSAKQDGPDVQPQSTQVNHPNQSAAPPEETVEPPHSLKPNLVGLELSQQPAVEQGVELSGLCSIM